jgi:hypothetical protein
MRSDFSVVIPTHGRSDRVYTERSLRASGYTGAIYLVVDDGDKELDKYRQKYGDKVLVFSKAETSGTFDKMDNFGNTACVVYARNALYKLCAKAGLKQICVMDDDYTSIQYRITPDGGYYAKTIKNADDVFEAYLKFMDTTKAATICFAQGGDYIGGSENQKVANGFKTSRKMMNVYFFDVERPLSFMGTLNEDLTASVMHGQIGKVILTSYMNSIVQKETQSNSGGLTEIYLEMGTYQKSFYSVIAAPSCVKISAMGDSSMRIHHEVRWKNAVPKIVRQDLRK